MHGELAQLIALAAHGTAFLQAGSPRPELFPGHSTFRFVGAIDFVRVSRLFGVLPVNRVLVSTTSWLGDLRKRGVRRLQLLRMAGIARNRELLPHIEAGFSNGLDVGLLARATDGSAELWVATWKVAAANHAERRIWSVSYRGEPADERALSANSMSLDAAASQLHRALEATRELALDNSWHEWANVFRGALAQLASDAPTIGHHPDLLPSIGYGLRARQVLAAVGEGWVLGGMGSWNDLAAQDEARYAAASAELHSALINAAIAAANSFEATDAVAAV